MKHFGIAALTMFLANTAVAETVIYSCKMTKQDSYNWIAPEYAFRVDTETGAAQAISGHHDWTDATLKVKSDNKLRILWNVSLPTSQGQDIRMKYQANLDAGKKTVRVRASFATLSAANRPFGVGNCKIV